MTSFPPASQEVDLSVVVPIFDEEENVRPLLEELEQVLRPLGCRFEVIGVDDGSTDRSEAVLKESQATRPWLRVLRHRVNAGQSAALVTGFRHARGRLIVTLDADLQNDPHDIPTLLEALNEEVAAVCGIRRQRQDNWLRRLSSRVANAFRNWVTGDTITDAGCTFRVLRRDALQELPVFNGLHRFLPSILRWQGYRVVEVPVRHRPRVKGYSKYGVRNRAWRGFVDCLAMRWYRRRCILATRCEEPPPESNQTSVRPWE